MTFEIRVCAAGFLVYLAVGATGPLLPEVRRALGLSAADIGVVVAAFGLARLCLDLPTGPLAARFGFRLPFLLGALLLAVGSAGSAAAASVVGLAAAQALAGVGCVLCHVTALVVLSARAAAGHSGRLMGFYFGATFAGLAIGGAIAGQLAAGWGWRAAFAGAAGFAVAGLGAALALRGDDAIRRRPTAASGVLGWRDALTPRLLSIYLLHFTALFLWAGVRTAVWPSLAADLGGLSVEAIGLALGIGSFVTLGTLVWAGALGDRWGKRPVLTVGLLASAVGLAVPVLGTSALALLASLLLLDLGQGILAPVASALLADLHDQRDIGAATGVMRLLGDVGWLVGPLLVTGLIEWRDHAVALALAALVPLGNLLMLRICLPADRAGRRGRLSATATGPGGR